jgi:hypothetical protein
MGVWMGMFGYVGYLTAKPGYYLKLKHIGLSILTSWPAAVLTVVPILIAPLLEVPTKFEVISKEIAAE